MNHSNPVPSPAVSDTPPTVKGEAFVMFEGVNNALKLFGDQYLARVYRLAAESIHDKIAGFLSAKRMEVLEVVIVALIAVSIALPFFGIK